MFRPLCGEVFAWYSAEAAEIARQDFMARVVLKRIAAGGLATVGVGGGIVMMFLNRGSLASGAAVARQAAKSAQEIWNSATPEHYRGLAFKDLNEAREHRLDARCAEIAMLALQKV
jgi:hypothetical protein